MRYYFVEPEVPGGWGDDTVVLDNTVHPPIISKLHYEFDGWPEDVLITSFPVYLFQRQVKPELEAIRPTGVQFDKVRISKSEEFRHFFPHRKPPEFIWLNSMECPAGPSIWIVWQFCQFLLAGFDGVSHVFLDAPFGFLRDPLCPLW